MRRIFCLVGSLQALVLVHALSGCASQPTHAPVGGLYDPDAEYQFGEGGSMHLEEGTLRIDLQVANGRLIWNGEDAGEYRGESIKILPDGRIVVAGKVLPR